MKIAIPVENGRLCSHFGGSRHFCIVDVDEETSTILRFETLDAPEHKPGLFPLWLRDQGAQVVIAGGIGQRALGILAHHGIRVVAGQADCPAELLAAAYLEGKLLLPPAGCTHHEEHDHHHHGRSLH